MVFYSWWHQNFPTWRFTASASKSFGRLSWSAQHLSIDGFWGSEKRSGKGVSCLCGIFALSLESVQCALFILVISWPTPSWQFNGCFSHSISGYLPAKKHSSSVSLSIAWKRERKKLWAGRTVIWSSAIPGRTLPFIYCPKHFAPKSPCKSILAQNPFLFRYIAVAAAAVLYQAGLTAVYFMVY